MRASIASAVTVTIVAATMPATISTAWGAPDERSVTISYPARDQSISGHDVTLTGSLNGVHDAISSVQYVLDLSHSTLDDRDMDCNGDGVADELDDLNGDNWSGDILDCEIAAIVALNGSLRTVPNADARIQVGLTVFATRAAQAQMRRDDTNALFIPPGTTGNGRDIIPNVNFVASSAKRGYLGEYAERWSLGGGTSFDAALTAASDALSYVTGPRWIFFLSDGQATVDPVTLDNISLQNIRVRTFAIGRGVGSEPCDEGQPLRQIADAGLETCTVVTDPSALKAAILASRPGDVSGVSVNVGGQTFEATIDSIGNWQAPVTGLPRGWHVAAVTATYADGGTAHASVRFHSGEQLSYVALGDSYAAGEGLRPYYDQPADPSMPSSPSTREPESENYLCHRSTLAWPHFVAVPGETRSIYAQAGAAEEDTNFALHACSGGRIVNLDTTPQAVKDDWYGMRHVPVQLTHVGSDTDLVTLSIGGNDLGFVPLFKHCYFQIHCWNNRWIDAANGTGILLEDWLKIRLALIGGELTSTYTGIRDRVGPDGTIVATTYPRMFAEGDTLWLDCWGIGSRERNWIRSQIDVYADIVWSRATRVGGPNVVVADVREDFEGHNVCNRSGWISGAVNTRAEDQPGLMIGSGSFHPKETGSYVIAAAVNRALWKARFSPGGGSADAPAGVGTSSISAGTATPLAGELDLTPHAQATPAPSANGLSIEPQLGVGESARSVDDGSSAAAAADEPLATDRRIVDDPDAILAEYSQAVIDAVAATTFAHVGLGNGAAMAGLSACNEIVESEIVPFYADGFGPGSTVTAQFAAASADGDPHASTTVSFLADDSGTIEATMVAPPLAHGDLVGLTVRGTNTAGGPVFGTELATGTTDIECRSYVAKAQLLAGTPTPSPSPSPSPSPTITPAPAQTNTSTPTSSPSPTAAALVTADAKPPAGTIATSRTLRHELGTTGASITVIAAAAAGLLSAGLLLIVVARRHARTRLK